MNEKRASRREERDSRREERAHRREERASMGEKRVSKRVAFTTTVHFAPPARNVHEHASFIMDLSDTGVGIRTRSVLKPGAEVLFFVDYHYDSYKAKGEVVWVKNARRPLSWFVKNKAGIKYRLSDYRLRAPPQDNIEQPPFVRGGEKL